MKSNTAKFKKSDKIFVWKIYPTAIPEKVRRWQM